MKRREFLATAVTLPLALKAVAAGAPVGATPMLARYHLTRDRVLHGDGPAYTPDFLLEDITATPGRRFTNFSGDVSGRWVGALATCSAVFGDQFASLGPVVARIVAKQHEDGYFGKTFRYEHPDDDDLALLWGNGRLLVGLMEYYGLTKDEATLAAAKRLGDFLVKLGPKYNSDAMAREFGASHFASSYICWTQQTEGLAALYAATRDERYKELCVGIAGRIERRPADHVHGYLSSLRGVMALYETTGAPEMLKLVEREWQSVMDSHDVLITGGVPEAWSPKRMRTEGCAECDWLRLNLQMWKATGDAKYIAMAERTLFNEMAMNQFSTGDFGHGELDAEGVPQMLRVRAWWCCTLHGMRAFADVAGSIVRLKGDEASFDLPVDGAFTQDGLSVRSVSTMEKNGCVTIHVAKAMGQSMKVRQPAWAESMRVTRNGVGVSGGRIAGLKAGDTITVTYAMAHRSEAWGGHGAAFWYGPWLLGAASSVNPGYFNELQRKNRVEAGSVKAAVESGAVRFGVPAAAAVARYLPAEFPEQPQRVELRAVAEQTGMASTPWQIVFDMKTS